MSDVVPFGKYKGRQVEEMIADKQYCDWLQGQPWFGERFPQIRMVILNIGKEPEDTPEHNEQQARFLDPAYCVRLWRVLCSRKGEQEVIDKSIQALRGLRSAAQKAAKDAQDWVDQCAADEFSEAEWQRNSFQAKKAKHQQCLQNLTNVSSLVSDPEKWSDGWSPPTAKDIVFEVGGWDVAYTVVREPPPQEYLSDWHHYIRKIVVECKPVVADDYPAVLRQVLKRRDTEGIRVVFADKVQPSNVSGDQVAQIFASQGIILIDNTRIRP